MKKYETGGFNEGYFWMLTDNTPELVGQCGTMSPETTCTADSDKIVSSLAESVKDTVERVVKQWQSKQ